MGDIGKKFGMIFGGIILFMIVQACVAIMDTGSMSSLQVFLWQTVVPLLVTVGVVWGLFGAGKLGRKGG